MTPGPRFSATTSQSLIRRRAISLPSSVFRSMTVLRLLLLSSRKKKLSTFGIVAVPQLPRPVAIRRPLDLDDVGAEPGQHLGAGRPAWSCVKSMTRMPSSAWLILLPPQPFAGRGSHSRGGAVSRIAVRFPRLRQKRARMIVRRVTCSYCCVRGREPVSARGGGQWPPNSSALFPTPQNPETQASVSNHRSVTTPLPSRLHDETPERLSKRPRQRPHYHPPRTTSTPPPSRLMFTHPRVRPSGE